MEALAKGDVVLFPFPYTDLSTRKLRPCLVLSSEMREDVLLCQITSKKTRPDSFAVELGKTETLNGSLQVDSFIRANMLFTAQKRQVLSKVCSVSGEKYSQVVEKITRLVSK